MMGFIRFLRHLDDNLVRMSMPSRPPWRIFGSYGRQLFVVMSLTIAWFVYWERAALLGARPFTSADLKTFLFYVVIVMYPIRGWVRSRRENATNTA